MKLVTFFFILLASNVSFSSETFRVATPFLPKELKPRDGQLNIGQYISIQAYYPLLSEGYEGAWQSNFLDMENTKALDSRLKSFRFCLKNDLKFNDGSVIKSSDLKISLERFHSLIEQTPPLESIKVDGNRCVKFNLKERAPRYFSSLQGIASTILKSETEKSIVPIGLGPYKVTAYSENRVELTIVNEKSEARFHKIEFEKVNEGDFNPSKFSDINPVIPYFKNIKLDGFKEIKSRSFKTYALVVNVPSAEFRKCLAKEVDIASLVKYYGLKLRPLPGFLPQGIPGYKVNYSKPTLCKSFKFDKPVVMIVPFKAHLERLLSHKGQIFGKMAKYVQPKLFDPAVMSQMIFARKPYISIIGFDSSSSNIPFVSEASLYFESFCRENRILTKPLPGLRENLLKTGEVLQKAERFLLYKTAHQLILRSGFIVPLGESISSKMYPAHLKTFVIADPLSGYPQIQSIR